MTERLKITYYMWMQGLQQIFWRIFLWIHPPQLSTGDYFLCESRWQNRFSRLLCTGQLLTLSASPLWRYPVQNSFAFWQKQDLQQWQQEDFAAWSRNDTETAEGLGGQTVSQEVIYLTRVLFQGTSHHRKEKCWTRASTPLTFCVQLLPPP